MVDISGCKFGDRLVMKGGSVGRFIGKDERSWMVRGDGG